MTVGSGAAVLLVLAWSRVESLPVFYLIWAGIGVTMAATFYEPAFVTVANWFACYRGRALTLLTFGGGFASVIFIPLADRLIVDHGWRTALVVLACILAVVTIPAHVLLLRRHPQDMGLLPDGAREDVDLSADRTGTERSISLQSAVHGPTFWWLTGSFFLIMFANVALLVHLIPFLTDEGFDERFAAYATGFVGLMALPGRLFFTPLGGRFPRQLVTALIFGLQAVAIVVLIFAETKAGVWLFVILFGAGFGAITPARAALVAETYGPAEFGAISGLVALFITIARAAGPIGASVLYDLAGGYQPVMWVLFASSATATVAILFAGELGQAVGFPALRRSQ
jgi:cyanate permease